MRVDIIVLIRHKIYECELVVFEEEEIKFDGLLSVREAAKKEFFLVSRLLLMSYTKLKRTPCVLSTI